MRSKWCLRFTVLALVLLVPGVIFAGTTGKIAGYCKDQKTGDPLPAVNIVVEGTTMGASSDVNGYYVILNVPVGVYTLKASMMGYKEVTVEGVKVTVDLTSWQNFEMEPTVIIGETVTVTAERPLIEPDVTMSRTLYDKNIMSNIGATSVNRVIELTSGYVRGSFRGGRVTHGNRQAVTYVDGVSLANPIGYQTHRVYYTGEGTSDLAIRLDPLGIEEMEVITGGFNAEYGNTQSAVVNIVTKEGGRRHVGEIRYTFDLPALGYIFPFLGEDIGKIKLTAPRKRYRWIERDRYYRNMFQGWYTNQYVEWSMGGILFENLFNLIPGTFYYHTSGEYSQYTEPVWTPDRTIPRERFDINNNAHFKDTKADQYAYSINAKITYRPSAALKFTIKGMRSHRMNLPWRGDPLITSGRSYYSTAFDAISGLIDTTVVAAPKLCLPEGDNDPLTIPDSADVVLMDPSILSSTWMFTSNQLGLSMTHTLSAKTFYDVTLSFFENNSDRITRDPATGEILDYWDDDWRGVDAPRFKSATLPLSYGMVHISPHYISRSGQAGRQKTWTLRANLTSQVTDKHQVKAGIEGKWYRLYLRGYGIASGGNDYNDKYRRHPWYFAAYVQDKMELLGMIVNAGYRMDVLSVESVYPADYLDPLTGRVFPDGTREIKNPKKTTPDWAFSPRLGVSFPITAGDVLHFTYGHYFQFPPFDAYFTNTNYDLRGAFHYVGNPNLKPEKTVSYEFGMEHQFLEDLGIDVTGFYKDVYDLVNMQEIIDNRGLNIYYNINYDYANVKGVEFTLTKRYKYNFSAQVSYTLQWSSTRTENPEQSFSDLWSVRTPRTKFYRSDHDQRHTINVNVDYRVPENWGPMVLGKRLLGDWGVNLLYRAGSGNPFSSRQLTIQPPINDQNWPWWHQVDMRINKDFKVLNWAKISFFTQIYNVFNWTRIFGAASTEWYLNTRDHRNDWYYNKAISEGGELVNWRTGKNKAGVQVAKPHDYPDVEGTREPRPTQKGSARRIQVGISIKFM